MQPYHTTCKWCNYVLVCIAEIFTTIFKFILIRAGSFIIFSRPITLQHEIKSGETGLHIPRYVPLSNLAGYTFHGKFHLPFSSSTFHFRWVTFAYGRLHYPASRQIKRVIVLIVLIIIIIIISIVNDQWPIQNLQNIVRF